MSLLKHVVLIEDIHDPETYEHHYVESVTGFLRTRYAKFPAAGKIYHDQIALSQDVTPHDEKSAHHLESLDGQFWVLINPGDPTGGFLTFALIAITVTATALALMPKIPTIAQRNQTAESPNNTLSDRQNQPRVGGRIPDIYGQVRSTPDLLAVPYTVFENNQEVEYMYACIGRGFYEVADAKDGDTLISEISGASVEVYDPMTSPNSGDSPAWSEGDPIDEPVYQVQKVSSVNGQVLRPPNANSVKGNQNIKFVFPNEVHLAPSAEVDFEDSFESGDSLVITGAGFSSTDSTSDYRAEEVTLTPAGRVTFTSFNPSTVYVVGETIELTNALFAFDPSISVGSGTTSASGSGTATSTATTSSTASTTVSATTATAINRTLLGKVTISGTEYSVDFSGTIITADSTTSATASTSVTSSTTVSTVINSITTPGVPTGFTANATGTNVIDLSGVYVISAVTSTYIELESPETVVPDWSEIANFAGDITPARTIAIRRDAVFADRDLNGTYTVSSVSSSVIVLGSASSVNANWSYVENLPDEETPYTSALLSTSGPKWIGPFVLTDADKVFINLVALNGLYKDDGEQQYAYSSTVTVELTPVNASNTPTGSPETFTATLTGNDKDKSTVGVTLVADPTFSGRMSVRLHRSSATDKEFDGQVIDETKARDLYAVKNVPETDFGNITTVQAKTYATSGALSLKERKLNLLVTRKIPQRVSGTTFSTTLYPTKRADEIFCAVALDEKIGRRLVSELNVNNIYDTVQDIEDYFGTEKAVEFSYTFDKSGMSYEETATSIATSVFCTAVRRGSLIELVDEKAEDVSVMLFNHRNKIPGTEKRTVRFGPLNEYDGVEVQYISDEDDSVQSFYVPEDMSAINYQKIETIGFRGKLKARFFAYRAYNKMKYQRYGTSFDATAEANVVAQTDRILVSDNTRPETSDGNVMSVSGLNVTLSQPHEMDDVSEYVIFFQHVDETVEMIELSGFTSDYTVTLSGAPSQSLLTDPSKVQTGYIIMKADQQTTNAFLVTEKQPNSNHVISLSAINYDPRYYQNDKDFEDGVVDEDGNEL